MKYSILGFNQKQIVEHYPDINISDLLILDYVYDACASPTMEHCIEDGHVYTWLSHKKLLEDLPILDIGLDRLKRRFKILIDLGLIISRQIYNVGRSGSKTFYSITEACECLRYETGVENNTWVGEAGVENNTSYKPLGSIPSNSTTLSCSETVDIQVKGKEEGREREKDRKVNEQEFLGSAKTIAENVRQHDTEKFVALYHKHCPDLPTVRSISDTRKKAIRKLIKKYSWDDIIQVFDSAQGSDFLKGKNDRGWKADLDFILREDKFISILEGKYNTKRRTKDGLVLAPRATKEERDGRKYEF